MALEAVRELLEHYLSVRLAVAILALRNISVLRMAFCTGNLTMLTGRCTDFVVYLAVATTAYRILGSLRILYLQRVVCRMAGQTFLNSLPLRVRFMAFHAARDISVLLVMALGALYFRMLTRIRLEYLGYLCVAITADLGKFSSHSHLCLRGVGV